MIGNGPLTTRRACQNDVHFQRERSIEQPHDGRDDGAIELGFVHDVARIEAGVEQLASKSRRVASLVRQESDRRRAIGEEAARGRGDVDLLPPAIGWKDRQRLELHVLHDADAAGVGRVAGDREEVDQHVDALHGAHQVGKEDQRALEHADEHHTVGVVVLYGRPEASDDRRELGAIENDARARAHSPSASSIARRSNAPRS